MSSRLSWPDVKRLAAAPTHRPTPQAAQQGSVDGRRRHAAELPTIERYELHAAFGPRGSGKTKGFAGKEDIAAPFENRLDLWPEIFVAVAAGRARENRPPSGWSEAPCSRPNEVPAHCWDQAQKEPLLAGRRVAAEEPPLSEPTRDSGVIGRQYALFNRKAGGGLRQLLGKEFQGVFLSAARPSTFACPPIYLRRHPWEHTVVSDGDLFSKLSLSWYPAVGEERS